MAPGPFAGDLALDARPRTVFENDEGHEGGKEGLDEDEGLESSNEGEGKDRGERDLFSVLPHNATIDVQLDRAIVVRPFSISIIQRIYNDLLVSERFCGGNLG